MLEILFDANATYCKEKKVLFNCFIDLIAIINCFCLQTISAKISRLHDSKKRECTALWACPTAEWPHSDEQCKLMRWNRRKGFILLVASLLKDSNENEQKNLLGYPIVISKRNTIREYLWAQQHKYERSKDDSSPRTKRAAKRAEKSNSCSCGGGGRRNHYDAAPYLSALVSNTVMLLITQFL